jgi:hypothetical protein
MTAYRIDSIQEENLPEVVAFLRATIDRGILRAGRLSASQAHTIRKAILGNPTKVEDGSLGHVVRGEAGGILGINLMLASRFVYEDKILVGLCSSNFFVDAAARMQGFLLFRKFLATRGVDFWYATSSNEHSGTLWEKLKGQPVASSDRELFLPLRMDSITEELVFRRGLPVPFAVLARATGSIISPFLKPRIAKTDLTAKSTTDWQTMSELAERHRDRRRLTCLRSVEHLKWKYEGSGIDVYEIFDSHGEHGWFAIGLGRRGTNQQIRICTLLDWVWPSAKLNVKGLVRLIIELYGQQVDALVFMGPPAMALHHELPQIWENKHGYHRTFVIGQNVSGSSLAEIVDFMPADGG